MSTRLVSVSAVIRKLAARANLATIISIAALGVAIAGFAVSWSAHQIQYTSADGRIDKHRTVATAFAGFVRSNCIDEMNSLCETYLRSTQEYLETYAAAVEREAARLTDAQYDAHLWEMQQVRITLAVAEI